MVKEFSMTDWERQENWRLISEDQFKPKIKKRLLEILNISTTKKEQRNDIYIYETLLYPPKSTPPTQ